mmetsp:Transcript_20087/g.26657  ORF Transcript_20087/g.26657 Transcript_20087/m.26657 type:complete len:211 (+) Transcript_20087:100-732(+)
MIESSDETAPTHNNENTAADTNGKRDEKILSFFQPTTTSLSEKRLAQTLGYPATWHVVRTVSTKNNVQAFCDRIYAGPPSSNPDTYYNHGAAMAAALRWIEGKSTPHDNEGGQMNPRVALFEKDEYVEVLYEPDEMWYGATIMKCVMYQDDIRYVCMFFGDVLFIYHQNFFHLFNCIGKFAFEQVHSPLHSRWCNANKCCRGTYSKSGKA